MADIQWCFPALVLYLFSTGTVQAGSYCWENLYASTTYCDTGCCGNAGSQYCCSDDRVGLIVGCVFGGIFLVSVIIVVICCCIKKKSHSGKVVSPSPGTLQPRPAGVAVVQGQTYSYHTTTPMYPTGTYVQQGGHGYGPAYPPPVTYPVPPPAYDSHVQPPAYGVNPTAPYTQSAPPPQQGQPTTQYGANYVV